MANELCMNCFGVKGQYTTCPFCGYIEGTPTEQPYYLMPGSVLKNHFIVGTVIGVGEFGITYKCYDTTLGVIVAIKEFYPKKLVNRIKGEKEIQLLSDKGEEKYQEGIKHFRVEAQSIAKFGKAKDIVNVFDVFYENNTAYIVMEYIEGILLEDYIEQNEKLSVKDTLNIIRPVISAVKKIHASGIIHRDISPDNIFITENGDVKLFDFGTAVLNDGMKVMSIENIVKGVYSAPEQYLKNEQQGYYTDIYSIGAIMYQMLTGVKVTKAVERRRRDRLKSPLELGVDIDDNLDRAIMEALAVQPEFRFPGIQQLEDAINGKRRAEYPKDKLKRRKVKKIALFGILSMAVIIFLVGKLLLENVSKNTDKLYNEKAKIDSDTEITVWVDSDEMTDTIKGVVSGVNMKCKVNGEEVSDSKVNTENGVGFTDEQKKENPRITVDIINIQKYGFKNMDDALEKVDKEGGYPDVIQTDNISDISKYKDNMVSLKDNVYAMLDVGQYSYMAPYKSYYSDTKQMPTSFNLVLLYVLDDIELCTYGDKKKKTQKTLASKWSALESEDNREPEIDIEELLSGSKKEDAGSSIYIDSNYATLIGLYRNIDIVSKDGKWDKENKELKSDIDYLNSISDNAGSVYWPEDILQYKKNKKKYKKHYGMNILSGIEYREKLDKTQAKGKYKIVIPTVDGRIMVRYSGVFSAFDNDSSEKKLAAERLIYYLAAQEQFIAGQSQRYPMIIGESGEEKTGLYAASVIVGQYELVNMINDIQVPCEILNVSDGMLSDSK